MKLSAYAAQILNDARLINPSELELHRTSQLAFLSVRLTVYSILQALRNMKAVRNPPTRFLVEWWKCLELLSNFKLGSLKYSSEL
jgi:hypothetical protein